jgi:UTP-glucose-1-phosphate uridylyltransferase
MNWLVIIILHKDKSRIVLYFKSRQELNQRIKKQEDERWIST